MSWRDTVLQVGSRVAVRTTGRAGEGVLLRFCNRNGAPRPEHEALYAVVAVDGGDPPEQQHHVRNVRVLAPPAGAAPSPEVVQGATPAAVEGPPTCERSPDYWKANERAGAIYLELEPEGTYRASLVLPAADGKSKQAANARGLAADDLEDQLTTLVRRLMRAVRKDT